MRITESLVAVQTSHQLEKRQLMEDDKKLMKKILGLKIKGKKALLSTLRPNKILAIIQEDRIHRDHQILILSVLPYQTIFSMEIVVSKHFLSPDPKGWRRLWKAF